MKQPEDTKTLELNLDSKRGRGRPRLEHALSQAERAKRYRDNKRMNKRDVQTVTQNNTVDYVALGALDQVHELEEKVAKLEALLEKAQYHVKALQDDQALMIAERKKAYDAYDQMKAKYEAIKVKKRGLTTDQRSSVSMAISDRIAFIEGLKDYASANYWSEELQRLQEAKDILYA